MESRTTDEDKSGEFVYKGRYQKKPEFVTLTLNRKSLAKETAITAKRHKIGIVAQRDMLANVVNAGGGNIEDFSLSNYTVHSAGHEMVQKTAREIKSDFKKVVRETIGDKKALIVHFDFLLCRQFSDHLGSIWTYDTNFPLKIE